MGKFRRAALSAGLAAVTLSIGGAHAADVQVVLGSNFGDFSVVNHGNPTSLKSNVEVQQLVGGAWQNRGVQELHVMSACPADDKPAPSCRSIGHDEAVVAVPWTGHVCYSQCPRSCFGEGKALPGTYRYVIKSCDQHRTFMSPAFVVPILRPLD